jgi:hypothetical protein
LYTFVKRGILALQEFYDNLSSNYIQENNLQYNFAQLMFGLKAFVLQMTSENTHVTENELTARWLELTKS